MIVLETKDLHSKLKEHFQLLGCAQLYDSAIQYSHVIHLPLKARTSIKRVAGPVFPVVTDNDMLPCLQALDMAPIGSVLFIHNRSDKSEALAGDIFVTAAKTQRLEGLIINGAVRDIDPIENMGFPVFSRDVTFVSAKTAQETAETIPAVISFSEFELEPGDWIFADSDGILAIKKRYLSVVYKAAMILRNREEELRIMLTQGERLSELCGLNDYLEGKGPLRFEA